MAKVAHCKGGSTGKTPARQRTQGDLLTIRCAAAHYFDKRVVHSRAWHALKRRERCFAQLPAPGAGGGDQRRHSIPSADCAKRACCGSPYLHVRTAQQVRYRARGDRVAPISQYG